MSAKTQSTKTVSQAIHSLTELDSAIFEVSASSLKAIPVKDLVGVPLVIKSAKEAVKSKYTSLTAFTVADPDQEFRVEVHGEQPRKVLAAVLAKNLFPISGQFEKRGGRYVLAPIPEAK